MKPRPYKIFPPRPVAGRVSLNGWWALWEQKRRRSRLNVSVPPFVPPDSVFWLNSESIGVDSGEAIAFWPDVRGAAQNASQATVTAQPLFERVTFAGKHFGVARFDTVDDGMATTASIFGGDPFAIFMLWRPADLGISSAAVSSGTLSWQIGTGGGQMICICEGLTAQAVVNTSDFFLIEVRLTPDQPATWAYVNGVQTGIITGGGTSPPGVVALGSGVDGLGLPGGCDLAELLIYNRGVSDDEAAGIRAYFQEQYNYLKL